MIGRKRYSENIRQDASFKNNLALSTFSSSNLNLKKSSSEPKITKEISNLYNMERSICYNCVKTKNKKYTTNKFIPCIPFPISS